MDDLCFNPRPREAGDVDVPQEVKNRMRFNPRPREAGDRRGSAGCDVGAGVSIHARVKRAT